MIVSTELKLKSYLGTHAMLDCYTHERAHTRTHSPLVSGLFNGGVQPSDQTGSAVEVFLVLRWSALACLQRPQA